MEFTGQTRVILFFLLIVIIYFLGFYTGMGLSFVKSTINKEINKETIWIKVHNETEKERTEKERREREKLCEVFAGVLDTKKENVCLAMDVAEKEGIDPLLFLALIYTESNFKEDAVSPKGYHGLAQIPWRIPWTDINLTIGARILKEKLQKSNNNTVKALMLYKGYPVKSKKGKAQVAKVIRLRKYLQLVMVEKRNSGQQ